MSKNQPQITAEVVAISAASNAGTITIQLSDTVKIVLEVANGGFVTGRIVVPVPQSGVSETDFARMIAEEQSGLDAQINAGIELRERARFGLGPNDPEQGTVEHQTDSPEYQERKEASDWKQLIKNFGRRAST